MTQNDTLLSKMVYHITNRATKVSCKVVQDQLGVCGHDGAIRFSIRLDLQLQLEGATCRGVINKRRILLSSRDRYSIRVSVSAGYIDQEKNGKKKKSMFTENDNRGIRSGSIVWLQFLSQRIQGDKDLVRSLRDCESSSSKAKSLNFESMRNVSERRVPIAATTIPQAVAKEPDTAPIKMQVRVVSSSNGPFQQKQHIPEFTLKFRCGFIR